MAGRKSYGTPAEEEYLSGDSIKWIEKIKHDALFKHIFLHWELHMPRTCLLEFEKHIIGVCSPNDPLADINRSTRWAMGVLLGLLKKIDPEHEGSWDDILKLRALVLDNIYVDDNMSAEFLNEAVRNISGTLISAYSDGHTTPDRIKLFLPECWITSGVWTMSWLAYKNILKQRYMGETGKPHYIIKRLVELMVIETEKMFENEGVKR